MNARMPIRTGKFPCIEREPTGFCVRATRGGFGVFCDDKPRPLSVHVREADAFTLATSLARRRGATVIRDEESSALEPREQRRAG